MSIQISASLLYDLIQCPHRVWMDRFVDSSMMDPVNEFTELLWDRGNAFESYNSETHCYFIF